MGADAVDVLVVGAGPTGLTLACELKRHGVTCRLVEELAEAVTYSKAAVVHSRTMEAFADMGVADAVRRRGKPVQGVNIFAAGRRLAHIALTGVDSAFDHPLGISQHETELLLAEHFAQAGGVVERGKRLVSFEETGSGVTGTLATGEVVHARYLVGADGAHSVVRKAMGCTFEGAPYEERIIQADLRVHLPSGFADDEIMVFLHEGGPVALFPLFSDGRYRMIVLALPGTPDLEPTLPTFERMLAERGPAGASLSDPAWMVAFHIHHRRTDHYRKGRAFVAGDAAHIHSPIGGQGMNTGIQDAYNLAWKFGLVLRGAAHESLLDSYEAERAPVAAALLSTTDQAMHGIETLLGMTNPVATALRDQLVTLVGKLSFVHERAVQTISMLSIGYKDSPIVRQDRLAPWHASVFRSPESEHPTLSDWVVFGETPGPGERAADAPLEGGGTHTRLFDLFRGTRHVALLFDGAASTAEGHAHLTGIGRALRDRLGEWVDVHVVVPQAARPAGLAWDGSVVLDPRGEIHRRYGARSECLYVIRPDGYIAYRSQPADEARLFDYLKLVFRNL
jgi:2-polyprenyl-6-methoxyphenol hydroxylase-like FAD-dependent oxidoreductase